MNAVSTVTPIRLRRWTPPTHYAQYERLSDGKPFVVRSVFPADQQVRIEADDGERAFPFANQLAADYREIRL